MKPILPGEKITANKIKALKMRQSWILQVHFKYIGDKEESHTRKSEVSVNVDISIM